jgi:hypothetical protein
MKKLKFGDNVVDSRGNEGIIVGRAVYDDPEIYDRNYPGDGWQLVLWRGTQRYSWIHQDHLRNVDDHDEDRNRFTTNFVESLQQHKVKGGYTLKDHYESKMRKRT